MSISIKQSLLFLYYISFLLFLLLGAFTTHAVLLSGSTYARESDPIIINIYRYSWYGINAVGFFLLIINFRKIVSILKISKIAKFFLLMALLQIPAFGLGSMPSLDIYMPLSVIHAFILSSILPEKLGGRPTIIAFFIIGLIVSFIMIFINPKGQFYLGYEGIVPIRYFGVLYHPNVMATASLVVLAFEWHSDKTTKLKKWAILILAFLSLLLSQGKTQWIGFVFLVIVDLIFVFYKKLKIPKKSFLISLLVASVWLLLFASIFMHRSVFWALAENATGDSRTGLTSMTGRSNIWHLAVTVWLRNPLFGYGPKAFTPIFGEDIGITYAHAHNQFLQFLAVSGIIGLIGFLLFLWTWLKTAIKALQLHDAWPLLFFIIFINWCSTDVPFQNGKILYIFITGLILSHLIHTEFWTNGTFSDGHEREESE